MTWMHLFVREGGVTKQATLHWRTVLQVLHNLYSFEGEMAEFLLVDLDEGKVVSGQDCFSLLDWKGVEGFEVEEV